VLWVIVAREAKVSDLNIEIIKILLNQQDVLWFEISMRYVVAVKEVNSQKNLVNEIGSISFT
jgi:hypothetical protein